MRILVPGRPQANQRDKQGHLLEAAKTYMDAVREAAAPLVERPHHSSVRIDLHFVYTSLNPLTISAWPQSNIPNADTAAGLALRALTGLLTHHKSQFNPLTVTRTVLTPGECERLHGTTDGATIITWETN
ncbi:MAG: hypothetical protein WDA15_06290 [Trueperaceae bacterium]